MTFKRQKSPCDIYHITCRGNSKQIIFEESKDYQIYLKILIHYKKNMNLEILAYCLMENHIHLLIKDENMEMSKVFGCVNMVYARYFNYKYEHVGHVFQGRFCSKPIYNEKQLLATFKYVLRNPEEANICRTEFYKWSSYEYYGTENNLVNTELLESLIGPLSLYKTYIHNDDKISNYYFYDDDKILATIIKDKFCVKSPLLIANKPKKIRDDVINYLFKLGANQKQITRLTGISYGIVCRVCRNLKNNS